MTKILALLWRRCGDADLRALLGRGGGHNVVAFGSPDNWREILGIEVLPEQKGGTDISIQPEPGQATAFTVQTYLHEGRTEVRIKVPPIITAGAQPSRIATENGALLDPDSGTKSDDLYVFMVKTDDGAIHLRSCLASSLVAPLSDWVSSDPTAGRMFTGVVLGPWESRVWATLLRHKNVLLYGPPGTGKTWVMLKVREAFEKGVDEIVFAPADMKTPFHFAKVLGDIPSDRRAEFVTFHQSLTYESFVVGFHPKPVEGGGGLAFSPKKGTFLLLAEHALKIDAAALLLVDELNRGNVPDILGELITVLEDDKRLSPDGTASATTVTVTLPLKPDGMNQRFQMPSAFYLLASMNSLDRSVAPLDSALRRRFRLLSVNPDLEVARELMLGGRADIALENPGLPSPDECKSLAIALLNRLNAGIRISLGQEFQLGQSYILPIVDHITFVDAFADSIFPQLYELFRDRPEDLMELLHEKLVELTTTTSELGLGISGAMPANLVDIRQMETGELMRALYSVAYDKPWTRPMKSAAETET